MSARAKTLRAIPITNLRAIRRATSCGALEDGPLRMFRRLCLNSIDKGGMFVQRDVTCKREVLPFLFARAAIAEKGNVRTFDWTALEDVTRPSTTLVPCHDVTAHCFLAPPAALHKFL